MIELVKKSKAIELDGDNGSINLSKPTLKGEAGKDGENGGYYIPYINEYCELYFTPTKPDMPKVNGRNIRGNKGEKGEAGADGKDGFSPNVYLGNIENGTRVYIVTKDGTKQFDVLNGKDGKDGAAKVTVKSKYFANDWEKALIMPNALAGSGEIAFITLENLPENAYIVDVSVHYYGVEYRLHDLVYYGEVSASTVVEIPRKPVYSKDNNWYIVARTHEDYESNKISDAAVFWDTNLEGFTVYYIEDIEEVEVKDNE